MNNSHKYCKDKVAKSGSSFYYSFLFLSAEQKRAITAIYAFCREVDDIVDECTDKEVAEKKLSWWIEELDRIYAGNATHPVGKELMEILKSYNLPKDCFEDILRGMAMDLQYQGYQTWEDLKLYCHCVASTVGILAAEVFGYQDRRTLEYAKKLGMAFQLINIIRDVGEDARRGRIYLPEEELKAFGISSEEILEFDIKDSEKFKAMLEKHSKLARSYYNSALETLPKIDRYKQRSGMIMAKIYFTLLDEIENSKFDILHQRISLTPIRKLWLAWKTMRSENKLCLEPSS